MIEVYPNLFVGSMYDYETIVASKAGWAVVHACKPYHRSASITLLYLATRLHVLPTDSFEAAEEHFRRLYPRYHATRGIREHVRRNWREYCEGGGREQ